MKDTFPVPLELDSAFHCVAERMPICAATSEESSTLNAGVAGETYYHGLEWS
jgi:hypothetical protein